MDRVEGEQVWIQGEGAGGGLVHSYVNAPASGEQGRRRWQLVRVPQYEHFSLQQDARALPWDGRTGGVLALDVRRKVTLNGHRLSVAGAGFRGGRRCRCRARWGGRLIGATRRRRFRIDKPRTAITPAKAKALLARRCC